MIKQVCKQIYFKLWKERSFYVKGKPETSGFAQHSPKEGEIELLKWLNENSKKRQWLRTLDQASPVPVGHWGTENARLLEGLPPCCLRHFTANLQKHKLKTRLPWWNSSRWDIQEIRIDDPLFIFYFSRYEAINNYFKETPSGVTSMKKLRHQKLSDLPTIMGKVLVAWGRQYSASTDSVSLV